MFTGTVLCVYRSEAIRHAATYLHDIGITVTDKCAPDVSHLLLPVPSFSVGDAYLAHYLAELPDDVFISGGGLRSALLENYRCVDFLQDPYYLAENAAITADCALQIVENRIPQLEGQRVLILGWGRIGKCLGRLMRERGCDVTVTVRKCSDVAMLRALGYGSIPTEEAAAIVHRFDVIVNTVPELILPGIDAKPGCVILELASKPGVTGSNIISALGLPGKMAPERSGKLIAETFIRLSL